MVPYTYRPMFGSDNLNRTRQYSPVRACYGATRIVGNHVAFYDCPPPISECKEAIPDCFNSSHSLQAITSSKAADMSVLDTPGVTQSLAFTMTTFSTRASCGLLISSCGIDANDTLSCNFHLTIGSSPFTAFTTPPTDIGTSNFHDLYTLSSNCDGCRYILSDTLPEYPSLGYQHITNDTLTTLLQFTWLDYVSGPLGVYNSSTTPGSILSWYTEGATMLANYTLSFYNGTLGYL